MGTEEKKVKFTMYMIDLMLAVIGYVLFVATDNNPLAGTLFVLPCIKENIEAFTIDRQELSGIMQVINWIAFGVSLISLVIFVLSAMHIINGAIIAAFLMLVVPVRYVAYVVFYYKS